MYKLIAIDLDNTLLDDNKEISKENIKFINRLIENGYEIVIATGRRYFSAKSFIQSINKPLTILANNGSIARETKNNNILFEKLLSTKDFRIIVERGKARNLHPIVHVDSFELGYDLIVEMDIENPAYGNYFAKDEKRYKKVNSYLDIEKEKILAIVYLGNKLDMEDFYLEINENHSDKYNFHIVENIKAAEALLEIMHPLGCKWQGLQEYAKERGIKEREIIAIGDDNNDITMLKNAGLGIAMKNASKNVKSIADIITERDNNQSGVAFELARILKL
ncbi:MAG: Cof-type HAD-IIB family hydrolase [Tissierellia bacterium]|nr:Cof-type HAD-IIB family hydrolase [Tissierellia bacterium]